MVKTLTPVGNGLGLIIEPALLERFHINSDTPLEVTIEGEGIFIRPVERQHRDRVVAAAERVMDIHEETLRKLAL
jgi:antitoxin component of MazEF toxin-antitoxin module